MSESANPYASPVEFADGDAATDVAIELKETTFANALFRWSFICVVSAGPSFFLGLAVTNADVACIVAMILGIAAFIFGYATLDTRPIWRRWMSTPILRTSIITAYTIRCVVSVLVPVGMANDMMIGMASVSVGTVGKWFENSPTQGMSSVFAFATTIVQGTLLSLEIALIVFLVYGIIVAANGIKRFRSPKSSK